MALALLLPLLAFLQSLPVRCCQQITTSSVLWYQGWTQGEGLGTVGNRHVTMEGSAASPRPPLTPPASVLALLPAPNIFRRTPYRVYPPGEPVMLVCAPPHGERGEGYRFFFQKEQQGSSTLLQDTSESQLQLTAEKLQAGSYTCVYWRWGSKGEISSSNSSPLLYLNHSLAGLDASCRRAPAPRLTVSPPQPVYITGENVTLTCSAAGVTNVSWIRFFRNSQKIHSMELPSPRDSYTDSLQLSGLSGSHTGAYTCEFCKTVYTRTIPSATSSPINITVTDPPPQPVLSVDFPSGAVTEGLPLLLACTAPEDTGERRFHFYKDGVEFVPRDAGSEISTMEPGSRSVKGSVLSIPWASPNDSGEFTCGYEDNVSGRWVPSLRSQTVNVILNVHRTDHSFVSVRELAVGGSFCLINSLIFLVSCYCS